MHRLIFALMLALAGCGGGDDGATAEPLLLATTQSEAFAGNADTGAATLRMALPGPAVELAQPATVTVVVAGTVSQALHYPARLRTSAELAGGLAATPLPADPHCPSAPLRVDYRAHVALPAGRTQLVLQVSISARDASTGQPTSALAQAHMVADWRITIDPPGTAPQRSEQCL